jgi:hypothetical protein
VDDPDIIRLTLANTLFSESIIYQIMAKLCGRSSLVALLKDLAMARGQIAGLVLAEITDGAIRLAWEVGEGPSNVEEVTQAAELAVTDSPASVVRCEPEGAGGNRLNLSWLSLLWVTALCRYLHFQGLKMGFAKALVALMQPSYRHMHRGILAQNAGKLFHYG